MAKFHFVEDYERYVQLLMRHHPIDEAMSIAVGGKYEEIGRVECAIMRHAGLRDGHRLVDFGCGSGRLAVSLAREVQIDYLGLDVVKPLIDYARTRCPAAYRFALNPTLTLPVDTASIDYVAAFSIFTHLLHTETYLYLEEMLRCLKPGGMVVCSFLEFAMGSHWEVFTQTVEQQRTSTTPHINQFTERNQITLWAERLGYASVAFIDGSAAPWPSGEVLGQSIALLRKA
ncbi:class I SAM-dependent methyltransferase [Methylobacterium haplocladii]|uniref:Methyltransferase domain-containing protein n=1 Tax=Methylobacterium haplocladii TaxID=1176176 RepID=A0A512IU83_9HYPH|nr:class I SAM-dependent methyltransferase [Methylobacterium haplocladii]GEP01267.1 hypothetical protein MHA02_36540 [Methylobacterium haplocladii]GJD86138.1 2-methoxy-6-polyprenyl-1,4-benzoquinol methylase, mitochondrial [Methylobacterium haplocladii]GLS61527.1 hypothetical protein GCM10007887_42440 [Methylobacterium haplocladii]